MVPLALRKELIEVAHRTHIGIQGCIRWAREALYWPHMSQELKDYISRCEVCLRHRNNSPREPLLQHEMPIQPWDKLGVDIAEHNG